MDLRSTQLKDTYGNLVTIGSVAGAPTTGTLQNGQGTDLTILTLGNSTATNFRLQLEDSTTNAQLIISSGDFFIDADVDGGNNRDMIFRVDGGDESMRLESNGDISFRDTSNNEAFYWDASAGSLGLGTTSPTYNLHIKGDSGQTRLTLEAPANEATSVAFQNTGSATKYLIGYNDSDDAFFFYDDVANVERLRIDSSGNVGIGKTSAVTELDIQGAVSLGENSAPTYFVFADQVNKTASTTHTMTVTIGGSGAAVCAWIVEIVFAGGIAASGVQNCGRATYAFQSSTNVASVTEIEDTGKDVTFATTTSGLDLIITATTTDSCNRVGAVVRLTRSTDVAAQVPTGVVIA